MMSNGFKATCVVLGFFTIFGLIVWATIADNVDNTRVKNAPYECARSGGEYLMVYNKAGWECRKS